MLSLAAEIISILAPPAILAVIGIVWAKKGPEYPIAFVTTLVMNVAMPGLLFSTLASSSIELSSLGRLAVAAFVVHIVFGVVATYLLKMMKKDWRLSIAYVVGNTGNLGLPVCYFAFGDDGLAYGMVFFAVQCVLLFSLGEAVLSGSASIKPALRSPILNAIWLGIVVRTFNLPVPDFIMESAVLVGQIGIPIMLITLGVSLAGLSIKSLPTTVVYSLVRLAIALFIGFGIAAAFGLEGVAKGVLVIETAMPVAVFNYLLAVRHNRNSEEISGLILVTHIAAIVYLPLLLGVLIQ
jgi:predicted permease